MDKPNCIFTDIDTILDTRIGTLYCNFGTDIKDYLEGYNNRHVDSFGKLVDAKGFRELYDKRDVEVLRNSMMSKVVLFIRDFMIKSLVELGGKPIVRVPKLIINTHPYDLSLDEKQLIIDAILVYTGKYVDIELVEMKDEDITPEYLNHHVEILLKYDFTVWLDAQAKTKKIEKSFCPDVRLLTPAILPMTEADFKKSSTDEDGKTINPFEIFKLAFAYFIEIEFLKPDIFCFVNPVKDM